MKKSLQLVQEPATQAVDLAAWRDGYYDGLRDRDSGDSCAVDEDTAYGRGYRDAFEVAA